MVTIETLSTLPAYETIRLDRGLPLPSQGLPRWGRDTAPPAIGATIAVKFNEGRHNATVDGYFIEEGFLGLVCTLETAPQAFIKRNGANRTVYVFGPEFV